jgi:multisubunit Na+/H+ antiporter MnhB subunit
MTTDALPRRSVILDACVRAEFHTLVLLSLYLLFAGHNQPGGGFSGGLVASCAFCLRFVAGGERALARSVRVAPPVVLGVGLILAVVTGLVPLMFGGQFLESAYVSAQLPVIGRVSSSSVLVLDTGVYLVVLGMTLLLLEQFGTADGQDPDADDPAPTASVSQPLSGDGSGPDVDAPRTGGGTT